jgi:putative DNA methylase
MPYRRKLIEVALPLEAINVESAREKSIRHGHPSTLHLWWARRPLAACRAVLFSQLVDDPSEYMPDEKSANAERERLFALIEELVLWENVNNEDVLDKAKLEIARSVARDLGVEVPIGKEAIREFLATKAPPVLDPFAGGGSIPLEAQRLGLRAYASDLNPVAVLINKALIEIPPKFANQPPVHPIDNESAVGGGKKGKKAPQSEFWKKEWKGAQGLAEDVRYYGQWMRDEAYKRIGHLYPPVKITAEVLAERPDLKAQGLKSGDELTVIAWLWARTVKCPNPACGCQMPLVRSFALSTKKDKQTWVEPVVERSSQLPVIRFNVRVGTGTVPDGTVIRTGAHCLACGTPVPFDHVRAEGQAGRMSAQMMAIMADGKSGRIYLPPNAKHETVAAQAQPEWQPETDLPEKALGFRVQLYGMTRHADLFTQRQLTALDTFCNLVGTARTLALGHVQQINRFFVEAYANAVATYLSFSVDWCANYWSTLATSGDSFIRATFSRQALAMVWDYAEANPFSEASGNFGSGLSWVAKALDEVPAISYGTVSMSDAATELQVVDKIVFSTDPPYYDNIGYADLSDFFYVWLRRSLSKVYPDLFATLLVPKAQELIATPHRFDGDKQRAEDFFENGLRRVFANLRSSSHSTYPLTVYYAFKQSEGEEISEIAETSEIFEMQHTSTGWETMLTGLIDSGFEITGTWPVRTERQARSVGLGTNALSSSIVLVCRPRPENAQSITRRDFLAALQREIPPALRQLQKGSIAPVDLAQAAIGPGMAVFSRYKQVLEADGSSMRVRTALGIINQALDEFLAEQEGEYDGDTRWALAWYEQYGHEQGPFGVAETLSKAKNVSVDGLVEAGILEARAGKVRILKREELVKGNMSGGMAVPTSVPTSVGPAKDEWDPQKDKRATSWEACQHLIYMLETGGEQAAANLLAKLGSLSDTAHDLAYRLYTICERKGWAQEALGYNMLAVAWPRLRELSRSKPEPTQARLV